MKGFIGVTYEYSEDVVILHYTQVYFVGQRRIPTHRGRNLKQSFEEIKEL